MVKDVESFIWRTVQKTIDLCQHTPKLQPGLLRMISQDAIERECDQSCFPLFQFVVYLINPITSFCELREVTKQVNTRSHMMQTRIQYHLDLKENLWCSNQTLTHENVTKNLSNLVPEFSDGDPPSTSIKDP